MSPAGSLYYPILPSPVILKWTINGRDSMEQNQPDIILDKDSNDIQIIGKLNIKAINILLGLNLPAVDIQVHPGAIKHIKSLRWERFPTRLSNQTSYQRCRIRPRPLIQNICKPSCIGGLFYTVYYCMRSALLARDTS
jgi:hypothetical protein